MSVPFSHDAQDRAHSGSLWFWRMGTITDVLPGVPGPSLSSQHWAFSLSIREFSTFEDINFIDQGTGYYSDDPKAN